MGAQHYAHRLAEWRAADDAGLDLMVNEHQHTPTCMVPGVPAMAAALAVTTVRARILMLGDPIANRREPVRAAEEMALVDNMCRGRLEVGFVREVPYEPASAIRPGDTTERMWEAQDLIVRAWEKIDEPFSWEGEHFRYRRVKVWPQPYQQPQPPVWVTTTTPSVATRIADHGYVAAAFLIGYEEARAVFDAYRERRSRDGLGTPDHRLTYCAGVHARATEAEGRAGAAEILEHLRATKVAIRVRCHPAEATPAANVGAVPNGDLDGLIERGIVFAGSATQVRGQIERFHERVGGFGHLLMVGQTGTLSHDATVAGIETFAERVYPSVKALGAVDGAAV